MPHVLSRLFLLPLFCWSLSSAQTLEQARWTTNGPVYAMAYDTAQSVVYLGGAFSYVGPYSGSFVQLDPSTGTPLTSGDKVAGMVYAVASDGAGGWYVGGTFTRVGGVLQRNLAHISADGSLDAAWVPLVNGKVSAIVVTENRIYIGGSFDSVGTALQSYAAALDRTTGSLLAWNPGLNSAVEAMTIHGGMLYVGGSFTQSGDSTRNRVASYDTSSGLITRWNPNAASTVRTIAATDTVVYLGGDFTSVKGTSRGYVASVDTITGKLYSWNPSMGGIIYAVRVSGTRVYLGGNFANYGGFASYVAGINRSNTTASWYLFPAPNSTVKSLAIQGDTIHLGGIFTSVLSTQRDRYASVRISSSTLTSHAPSFSTDVLSIGVQTGSIGIGGTFNSTNGESRLFVAALDASTGSLLPWNPGTNNHVQAIAVTDSLLFIGGNFSNASGFARNGLATFVKSTGSLSDWNPSVTSTGARNITSLIARGTTLFVGGQFDVVTGIGRDNLAKLRVGHLYPLDEWKLKTNGIVRRMVLAGSTLYIVGDFTALSRFDGSVYVGLNRALAGAVDTATGLATRWDPAPNAGSNVRDIVFGDPLLYLCGSFGTIGGQSRTALVALDTMAGDVWTAFDPQPNGIPMVMTLSGTTLYVGGSFSTIGGQTRKDLAALDIASGSATNWSVPVDGSGVTYAMVAAGDRVWLGRDIGGSLTTAGETRGMSVFDDPYNSALPVEMTGLTAEVTPSTSLGTGGPTSKVTLQWTTASEIDNVGWEVERREVRGQISEVRHTTAEWLKLGFVEGAGTSSSPRAYVFSDDMSRSPIRASQSRFAYRLKQLNRDGTFSYSHEAEVEVRSGATPADFELGQNFPNPFNPSTRIDFGVPVRSRVAIDVFDLLGQRIARLAEGDLPAGRHQADWTAFAPSGVYYYRMEATALDGSGRLSVETRRMVLVR